MSMRAVKNAVLARLREDSALKDRVFEGVVTNRPTRYVTVFSDSGQRSQERFTGGQWASTQTFVIHSVSESPDKAQIEADRVFAKLLDWTPTVEGRRCRRVRHASSQPVQYDTDVSPPLYYCVDEFDVTSTPY